MVLDPADLTKRGAPDGFSGLLADAATTGEAGRTAGQQALQQVSAGAAGLGINVLADQRDQINRVLDIVLLIAIGLIGLTVLIAVVGVGTTTALSVVERVRESGLLRAVGLSRGGLRMMLTTESGLYGVIGAAMGVLLGVPYAWLAVQAIGVNAPLAPPTPAGPAGASPPPPPPPPADSRDWPLFDLRLHCRDAELAPVREADLAELAALEPDDYELDPSLEHLPGLTPRENRQRLFHMGYWRSMGTWSPTSWKLHLAVRVDGALMGVQTLEGENFPVLRTVDTASWLVPEARGQGLGVAMRLAVLGLAFDHLCAVSAISSARMDNPGSLGVSRRIGYRENGVGFVGDAKGRVLLQNLRLPVEHWRYGGEVTVDGVSRCRPWFGDV